MDGASNFFEEIINKKEKDYLIVPDKSLFDLMTCQYCPKLDLPHILILAKIYAWSNTNSNNNEYRACRQPNEYFVNYFHKSKTQIKTYLNTLESYGLIIRYQNKLDFCSTKERYIWVNTKLINRLLGKEVLSEDCYVPSWAIENAKKFGWKECDRSEYRPI